MEKREWTKAKLVEGLRDAGLAAGDVVLVHSALRALGPVEGGADTVIDALLEVLGPEGTLALPTHTWEIVNAKQPVFHETLTPSNVGVLTNVFRKRPGVVRGLHPTHSVAAVGPRATELIRGHENDDTPCSETSPYGRLREWGGKVLIIGADLSCCTFFHGCEEWSGVSWALSKKSVQLFSIKNNGEVIPVQLYHHIVNTWEEYPRLEAGLLAAGLLNIHRLGECCIRCLDAKGAADWLIARLHEDPSIVLPRDYEAREA